MKLELLVREINENSMKRKRRENKQATGIISSDQRGF